METLQRTANRGSLSTGYEIDNSLKFEAANNESLQRAAVTGNRRTFTQSCWLKRSSPGLIQQIICYGSFHHAMRCMIGDSDDQLYVDIAGAPNALYRTVTNRRFRDPSAWYHIVIAIDTTQSTEANRLKIYVNGVQETSFASQSLPAQNFDTLANIASSPGAVFGNMGIGALPNNSLNNRTNGYFAEAISVDGQALDPTSFGEFDEDSGIWKPINVSGLSFGNNGYYLDFKDSSNLGNDVSGGTDWTENNIAAADQSTDTPTNNFCTLNPLYNYYNETSYFVITEGATKVTGASSSTAWRGVPTNFAPTSGKWYFELSGDGAYIMVGAGAADTGQSEWWTLNIAAPSTKAKVMYSINGGIYGYDSSTDDFQYGVSFGHGTAYNIGVAVDLDNGHMYFRKNGAAWTDSGDPTSGSTGTGSIYLPWYNTEGTVFIVIVANNGSTSLLNFGGYTAGTISSAASDANGYGTFEYAPPTGYYALCTKNLAEYG